MLVDVHPLAVMYAHPFKEDFRPLLWFFQQGLGSAGRSTYRPDGPIMETTSPLWISSLIPLEGRAPRNYFRADCITLITAAHSSLSSSTKPPLEEGKVKQK